MKALIRPGTARGTVQAPPSKSMAHRLLICAALAQGESIVRGVDPSEDILATVDCSGEVDLECTRCLETFHTVLNSHFEELFYFHYLRENEEAEQFLPESGYMDLQDLVREYLVMEIPYAPVCKEDCKGLCPICGKNLNLGPCDHPEE